jgi:hypothetical protein
MPIACDPSKRATFWLTLDGEKSEDVRPMFIARFITDRQWLKIMDLIDKADSLGTDRRKQTETLDEIFAIGLIDWKNMLDPSGNSVAFDVSKLSDVLTLSEKWQLVYTMLNAVQLQEADQKKSASPSASVTVSTAPDVQPVSA